MRKTKIFGFSMESRSARRRLVVTTYAGLAVLIAGGWFLDHLHTSSLYTYDAALLLGYFIFGGISPYGLIKPFNGKGPRNQPMPSSLVELHLAATRTLSPADAREYRNDERELQLRDRAHYRAYQVVFCLFGAVWLVSSFPLRALEPEVRLRLLLLLATFSMMAAMTLPQAILLWTEPDMEPQPAAASR